MVVFAECAHEEHIEEMLTKVYIYIADTWHLNGIFNMEYIGNIKSYN